MNTLTLRGVVLGSLFVGLYACSSITGGGSGSGPGANGGDGGACTPQCGGKTCGDDGCGGSCGQCALYQKCDDPTSACIAACDLTPLDGPKTINLNLDVVTVTGAVSWNGAALPAGLTNSTIVFTDKNSGLRYTTPLTASYSLPLYAGTYAVSLDTTSTASTTAPHQQALMQDNVVIADGAKVNIAATTATVSGPVTVDGQDVPQGAESRGVVMLRSASNDVTTAPLPTTGAATFTIPVFAGTYDFAFDSRSAATTLPSEYEYVTKGVSITANATQAIAMTTATVSGTFTQNGGAIPSDTNTQRGTVTLSSLDSSAVSAPVPATGTASYSMRVYSGTYDFGFSSTSSSSLPQQSVALAKATAISGTSMQSFDLKVVDIAGALTLNGGKMPVSQSSPGSITLVGQAGGGSSVGASIPAAGSGTLPFHIYAGAYDVVVDTSGEQSALPSQKATVQHGVTLTASGPLPIDLQTAKVSGTISVDGAAMPDDTQERGSLTFVERTTGNNFGVSAGTLGAATYSVTLYKSVYGLVFETADTNKSLPIQSTNALDANVTADTTLDVPLKTLTASGAVTLNGATLPSSSTGTRGSVQFLEKLTGSRISADVGQLGAANYTMKLFDGGYDVHFEASSNQTAVPQVDERVLSGCVPVDASCTQSDKDLSGTWLLNFVGWGTMELTLTQSGTTLTGYGDATWGGGPVTAGSRTSSGITFVQSSDVDITVEGDIANGCVMTGHAVASTGFTADWTGERLQQ